MVFLIRGYRAPERQSKDFGSISLFPFFLRDGLCFAHSLPFVICGNIGFINRGLAVDWRKVVELVNFGESGELVSGVEGFSGI
jgi:hypothetical protein